MTTLTTALTGLAVFASLQCVQSRPSEFERAGRLVRDGKVISADNLSLDGYHLLMADRSPLRRAGEADADAGNVPTAADLMGGASKGVGLGELWEGYKACYDEFEAEEEPKAIENMTEVLVKMASDVAAVGVPLGDGSQASAIVKSTYNFARKTASYAKTKCIPQTRLVKRSVQESVQMLNESLTDKEEMKRNQEYLMKTLDVVDGNTDELHRKMELALKQLAVMEDKIDVLDGRRVQLAEQMSRSYYDLTSFYQQKVNAPNYERTMFAYRQSIRSPLDYVHRLLVLNFISFNSTDELAFRDKHRGIVQSCETTDIYGILNKMSSVYIAPESLNGECGSATRFPVPLLLDFFGLDVVQASTFFYQVAADLLIATTVMAECNGARGLTDDTINKDLAAAQIEITKVLMAYRQAIKCYQKEYLTMWDEMTIPVPLNYIPLAFGQFKRAVSQPRLDPAEAADERKMKLFAFRSFLAYTPESPNATNAGVIDKRDNVTGADYSRNWGFIVNRFDTNKSKRDLAVVYADKCPYEGSSLGWAQGWGCNAALGYGFLLNGSEGNIVSEPHKIAEKCYDKLATNIGDFWARYYARSNDSKWQFTRDTLYSHIPEIFAEIESRDPTLLKGFLEPDFKCKDGNAPAFLPMAVHYGISFSYAPWLPTKNTTYFYAEPGESLFVTSRGQAFFYFHAIVYY